MLELAVTTLAISIISTLAILTCSKKEKQGTSGRPGEAAVPAVHPTPPEGSDADAEKNAEQANNHNLPTTPKNDVHHENNNKPTFERTVELTLREGKGDKSPNGDDDAPIDAPVEKKESNPKVAESPKPMVVEHSTPKVVEHPPPKVAESPKPMVVEHPPPKVVAHPAPKVAESPKPMVVEHPTPRVAESPKPMVVEHSKPKVHEHRKKNMTAELKKTQYLTEETKITQETKNFTAEAVTQ